MIDDAMVYRMARWLYERDHGPQDGEWIQVEEYRCQGMHALSAALQESIGPAVTIRWTPPSVRSGNRRKRLAWRAKDRREDLAFRLAPWLRSLARERATLQALNHMAFGIPEDAVLCPRCDSACFSNSQGWWCPGHGLVRWPSRRPLDSPGA